MKQEGYSIKDLEVLSGVKMHTIRIWEKRYDLLNPERTDTNIRYYSDEDLKKLLNVSFLTKNGYKISKIAGWDQDLITDAVLKISEAQTSDSDYVNRLLLLMINLDNAGFESLLNEIFSKYDFEDACYSVFFQLFEKVGTYWQAGSVFPAQEHYVSHLFRQKLIVAIDQLEPNYEGASILFFLPENELHELGLLFYSFIARKLKYNVLYLGQSVPLEDLNKVQQKVNVKYIFTSFVNAISKTELEEYLQNLKSIFQKQKIFITGHQVNTHSPALPRNVKVVRSHKEFRKYMD